MAKFLLTLFAVIVMCSYASAQKLSLTQNFSSALSITDTIATKPMLAVSGPMRQMDYLALTPNEETIDVERDAIEEAAKLRIQARTDAKAYYKPKGVFWGTLGTTILYPAAGLLTGAVVSIVPPVINDEVNPNAHLMKDKAYEEAFKKQAHRKRFGNAAAGFGIGVAVLGIVSKVIVGGL
ncbi:hypothetical protein [Pontibacter fetidus]|uniref:Secreted protein n=1 Tax=Pontibacter fetidus TaxID=2700082 RepID=A0A6B2H392_9BACT|nr:hypothetical protein [Pontibacter fetidus]NDK56871.1 hypothetical protein [Pontibacter fetidus]